MPKKKSPGAKRQKRGEAAQDNRWEWRRTWENMSPLRTWKQLALLTGTLLKKNNTTSIRSLWQRISCHLTVFFVFSYLLLPKWYWSWRQKRGGRKGEDRRMSLKGQVLCGLKAFMLHSVPHQMPCATYPLETQGQHCESAWPHTIRPGDKAQFQHQAHVNMQQW